MVSDQIWFCIDSQVVEWRTWFTKQHTDTSAKELALIVWLWNEELDLQSSIPAHQPQSWRLSCRGLRPLEQLWTETKHIIHASTECCKYHIKRQRIFKTVLVCRSVWQRHRCGGSFCDTCCNVRNACWSCWRCFNKPALWSFCLLLADLCLSKLLSWLFITLVSWYSHISRYVWILLPVSRVLSIVPLITSIFACMTSRASECVSMMHWLKSVDWYWCLLRLGNWLYI